MDLIMHFPAAACVPQQYIGWIANVSHNPSCASAAAAHVHTHQQCHKHPTSIFTKHYNTFLGSAPFAASCRNYPPPPNPIPAVVLAMAGAFSAGGSGTSPLDEEDSSFFDSHIVQTELHRIQNDYQHLLHLGKNFCSFDRQGKLSYISEMKDVLERWLIFYKRMELSDDFTAKLYAKQLKSKLRPDEESNFDMVFSFYNALDDMRHDAETSM